MILAIVQARMSSRRLPGKVMKEIVGKPTIGHLLGRLFLSRKIDKIVLATSDLRGDDGLAGYVRQLGFDVCRGSEDDVLDRFYRTAIQFGAEIIVRVTGDCPLIDPHVCDHVVDAFGDANVDYLRTGPTFAEGLDCEIFTLPALAKAWAEAKLPSEREHVTLYFHNHPEMFKILRLQSQTDDSRYRFVVDEEADFRVVTAVFEHFTEQGKSIFYSNEVKDFLDAHQDIAELNRHIARNEGLIKSLKSEQKTLRR